MKLHEILFKGQRTGKDPQWVEGMLIFEDGTTRIRQPYVSYKVHPESLGQWSTWTDKKGQKIYDGDIVQLVDDSGQTIRAVCRFGTARRTLDSGVEVDIVGFYFEVEGRTLQTFPIVNNYAGVHDVTMFEVVGNVFSNNLN